MHGFTLMLLEFVRNAQIRGFAEMFWKNVP